MIGSAEEITEAIDRATNAITKLDNNLEIPDNPVELKGIEQELYRCANSLDRIGDLLAILIERMSR